MATKNLGQVSGLFIGNTPPSNTVLIWYDDTSSQKIHKVFDPSLKKWVVLDKNIISSITYSELTNLAKTVGLSVGQYFQITDKEDVLAISITTTKVQYTDSLGNILIEDFKANNTQYHVTSSNLQIDDISGVFDVVYRKLVFKFGESEPDIEKDYIFGKKDDVSGWNLAKYRISSFLSKDSKNYIRWKKGFFFDFVNAIKGILDKEGGVVSFNLYDKKLQQISQSIENVGTENQQIIQNTEIKIANATSNEAIYNKTVPSVSTEGEPSDIIVGDKLVTIVSKIQRFINKFKYASGIKVAENNITVPIKKQQILPSDNVMVALGKLIYLIDHIDGSQITDKTITLNKITDTIIYTDVFKIIMSTNFVFKGGFGGIIIKGDNLMVRDSSDLQYQYDPYATIFYVPQLLSFIPVTPVILNDSNRYSAISGLIHHNGEGNAALQIIFQIPKETYDVLYASGKRFFKCVYSIQVYGTSNDVTDKVKKIQMKYVNMFYDTLEQNWFLNKPNGHNIVVNLSVTAEEN